MVLVKRELRRALKKMRVSSLYDAFVVLVSVFLCHLTTICKVRLDKR